MPCDMDRHIDIYGSGKLPLLDLPLLAGDLVLVDEDRLLRVVDAAAVVVHRVIEQSHLTS